MRILLANKFHYPKGGAELHLLRLQSLLISHGHEVAVFAMADPQNLPSPYSQFFVSAVDFSSVRGGWQGLRTAARMLYSFEAERKFTRLLESFKPDVVHVHNIYHQLSPSILRAARRRNIPVVATLHDYGLVTPNYTMYAHGGICRHGLGGHEWQTLQHRCIKQSFAASAAAALAQWFHRRWKVYERNISVAIAPSRFLADMVRSHTAAPMNIEVLQNFVEPAKQPTDLVGSHILFTGRLSEEKGIMTLLKAARGAAWQLRIAGTGPLETMLKNFVEKEQMTNVTFLRHISSDEIQRELGNARAVIVPSEWYENCPLSVLEAMSMRRPVVASRIGGLPELIEDGATGLLFPAGDSVALRQAIDRLDHDPALAIRLGQAAAARANTLSPQWYYGQLIKIYDAARKN